MEEVSKVKQAQKTFSRLGVCYIAGTVVVYLLEAVLAYVLKNYKPEWASNMDVLMILSVLIVYGCGMPLIALLVKGMEVQKLERHKMKWWQFPVAFVMCYSMMFVSNLVGVGITWMIGLWKGSAVENSLVDQITSGNMLINFVAMVIFAPVVEELVFRKLIVDRTAKYGQGIAILTSGLMFGLFHGNLNQFAYAMVLGCFFAFLYLRTGNLKITIALHAIINFMGSVIVGGLMKLVRYDELMLLDPNDTDAIMQMFMEDIVGWGLYILYFMFVFAVVITGLVFCILSVKKMRPVRRETDLSAAQGAKALLGNPGMIAFCIIWMVLIVIQLFR